ncbi:MAG: lysophospholipid acyltransferase family protein [bacterium]
MAHARKNIFAKLWRFFKPASREFLFPAAGLTYAIICRILMRTVRMKKIGFENEECILKSGKKFIYGFWDGRHIMLQPCGINKNIVTIASSSDAGEILTHIHRFYTLTCIRGSSSRGGISALKGMARKLRGGKNGAIAVDGPRGPNERAKPGIIQMAKMSQAVILPLTAGVKRKIYFKKYWNRVQIPLPGTAGRCIAGRPIIVPADADRQTIDKLLKLFEMELKRITELADDYC